MRRSRSFTVVVSNLGVAAVMIGLGVGIAVYTSKPSEEKNVTTPANSARGLQQKSKPRKDPVAVQEVINRIERSSDQFAQRIRRAFVLLQHPQLADVLAMPFELWEINQRNSNRNYPEFLQRVGAGSFQQEDINYYAYDLGASSGMAATFAPALRCMDVDEHFDPANDLDWLVLYHETHHAAQDTRWRAQLDSQAKYDAYLAFHTLQNPAEKRMIVNYETTAYAYELECLNLLMGDELRQAAAVGRYDLERLQATLNARPEQRSTIDVLWQLAVTYWPDGTKDGHFPPPFVRRIAQEYRARGYELYTMEHGQPRMIRSDEL